MQLERNICSAFKINDLVEDNAPVGMDVSLYNLINKCVKLFQISSPDKIYFDALTNSFPPHVFNCIAATTCHRTDSLVKTRRSVSSIDYELNYKTMIHLL